MEFEEFNKIPRLSRECVITEKIDGTNAQIFIETYGVGLYEPQVQNWPYTYAKTLEGIGTQFIFVGSRTKWITPKDDNEGFANWVKNNGEELLKLGKGRHYGEWWGKLKSGQRNYGLNEKRFSLFNTSVWTSDFNEMEDRDRRKSTICREVPICHVVPLIARITFDTHHIQTLLDILALEGSYAAPGFNNMMQLGNIIGFMDIGAIFGD